jgi:hypothetical protein
VSSGVIKTSAAKKSFDALLESNSHWFDWIEAAAKFENLLKDKIPWDQLDRNARGFVQHRVKCSVPARQVLLNSFYLTMVSGFEEYLREKIREATRRYSTTNRKYSEVEEAVRRTHVRESARLLRRMDSPPDYLMLNVDDLCRGLGSCVPNSEYVLLNPDAFADVESLVLLETFGERLAVFGIDLSLDVLGSDSAVKSALNLPRAKTREASKALHTELVAMRRNRNRIAHTGGSAADVTPELLSNHRVLLQAVASVIDAAF